MARQIRHRPNMVFTIAVATFVAAAGCSRKTEPEPIQSQPAAKPVVQPTLPAPTTPPAATAPKPAASRPAATQPVSTYDSKPPYPVSLYIRRAEDEQPGWLKILELADANAPATSTGTFPEKNHININTSNVARIRIHIGHLPLAEHRRIVLRIDEQPLEITRKNRDFLTLQRGPAGVWQVVTPPKE